MKDYATATFADAAHYERLRARGHHHHQLRDASDSQTTRACLNLDHGTCPHADECECLCHLDQRSAA